MKTLLVGPVKEALWDAENQEQVDSVSEINGTRADYIVFAAKPEDFWKVVSGTEKTFALAAEVLRVVKKNGD